MFTAVKRVSQVITHMGIGFALAATMSGSVLLGGLAVLIEPIINVVLLPFHERAWEAKVHAAATTRARYVLLAAEKISQTALHASVAFGVMWSVTGSLALGGLAALVEPVCNVIIMPLHDRLWDSLARRESMAPRLGVDTWLSSHSVAFCIPTRVDDIAMPTEHGNKP